MNRILVYRTNCTVGLRAQHWPAGTAAVHGLMAEGRLGLLRQRSVVGKC